MEIIEHLSKASEKYSIAAIALHKLISPYTATHSVKVNSNGIISYGTGKDGHMLLGLCVRSTGIMLYASADVLSVYSNELGKKRTGKTCLRIKKSSDVDTNVLTSIICDSLNKDSMNYGACSS